jgi:hypothetical protein
LKATELYEKVRVLKEAVMPEIVVVDDDNDDEQQYSENSEKQDDEQERDDEQQDESQYARASATMSDDADDKIMSDEVFIYDDASKEDDKKDDDSKQQDDTESEEESGERITCCGKKQLSLGAEKNYCDDCWTWVNNGRVIRCKCLRSELPPALRDPKFDDCDPDELEIDWLECTICSRSSHKLCCLTWYQEGKPFTCYACSPPSRRSVLNATNATKHSSTALQKGINKDVQVGDDQDDNDKQGDEQRKEKKKEEKKKEKTMGEGEETKQQKTTKTTGKETKEPDEKWHQCQYCAIRVNSFANLRSHHKARHSSSKLIAVRIEAPTDCLCQICGKDLVTNFKLSQHYYHWHMPSLKTTRLQQVSQASHLSSKDYSVCNQQQQPTRKKRSLAEHSALSTFSDASTAQHDAAAAFATTAFSTKAAVAQEEPAPAQTQKRVRTEKEQREYESLLALLFRDNPSDKPSQNENVESRFDKEESDKIEQEDIDKIENDFKKQAEQRDEDEPQNAVCEKEFSRACSTNNVVALDVLGAKISNVESLHYALTLMVPTKDEKQITRWAMLLKNQEVDSVHDLRCLPNADFEALCGIIGSSFMFRSALRALRAQL